MARGKTAMTARGEARLYLRKSDQFMEEAGAALAAQRYDACMLTAIHAAISGTDAVTVALAGRRSADPDHQRASDLLEEVAGEAPAIRERVRQLRALLARKNLVEYESRPATAAEAAEAVERAGRLVGWAREVVDRAQPAG
jgi:HEPN domain-containing protein